MYTLRSFIVLAALLGTVNPVSAKPLVAVLDFSESRTGLHADELSVLGDVSRGAALRALGHQYDVITRENLVDLLKAHGKNLSQCSGECETETGRLLGAELVVSGRIVKAFGKYKVNLKVHRTDPPALLGAEMMTADDHGGLEEAVRVGTLRVLSTVSGARAAVATPGPQAAAPSPVATASSAPAPQAAAAPPATDLRTEPWSVAITNGSMDMNVYSVGLSATGWLIRSPSLYWQAIRASWSAIEGDMNSYYFSATTSAGYRTSMGVDGRSELRLGAGLGWLMVEDNSGWNEQKTYEKPVASVEVAYSSPYGEDKNWVFVLEALFPSHNGIILCTYECDPWTGDQSWPLHLSVLLHAGLGF
jgi:hypothetical protein